MKMTFRWYGRESDPIPLKYVKQIPGMSGLMGLLDKPAGVDWPEEEVKALVEEVHAAGLELEVVESVNVHEDIKMGLPTRDEYIANYISTIRTLAKYGVKVIIYNFMPVFDWLRTDLARVIPEDGSNSLYFDEKDLGEMGPMEIVRRTAADSQGFTLPGWEPERLALLETTLRQDTIEECLEAVNSGEVDYTYGTSYTTPYYLNIDELSNILYLPTSTQSIDICFGLAQPVDPDLLVILNKALRSLNSAQLDSIIYDNSLIDQDEQINLFIKDHLGEFALACISLLVLIIVLLALYLRSRMHAARAVREENLRFQELYRLANEQFFEYSIKSDTLRISKSKSLLSSSYVDDATSMDDGSSYVSYENARQLIKHSANPELLDAFTSPSNAVTEVLCHEEANPDKDRKWIRITSHFVEDDAGKPISVIGKIANIDDEMREKMDLSERAHHDGLTGLLNWQTFQETAGELLSNGTAGAVLVVDTDDFKGVNDTYGHLAGDRALQQTAAALTAAFRPQDLIGRLGGDEFAICVNGRIDDERLASACAGIVKRGVTFTDQYGTEHEVTLSIGGVELHGKIASYQSAYRQADKALYRAKAGGKNRFVIGSYQAE